MKTKILLCTFIITILTGLVLAFSNPVGAALATQADIAVDRYVPDEVLVKFKPRATAQIRMAAVASQGHSVLANLNQPGWMHLKLGAGHSVKEALAAYQNDTSVEYVQPNYIYHIAAVPNDTQYGKLWAFKNIGQTISNSITQPPLSPVYSMNNPGTPGDDINIEKAWDHITDCSNVVVAVVDSGVNYNQEDLVGNMWNGGSAYPNHGYNYVNNNNDPMDLHGHGTHVAGIIGAAGNNAKGTTGVCWKANIMAVRAADSTGQLTTANIIQGVNFSVANGAKVINMSIGGGGAFDQAFSDAITNAQTNDVVVVVAAGNETSNNDSGTTPVYPCNFPQPNLVCVAALDQNYQLANFSNYGSMSVDVGAPGTNILSTYAGTKAVITDSLTAGWVGSSTTGTTGGGWFFGDLLVGGISTRFLVDPGNYPGGNYKNSTDDRAWKAFNLAGVNVALLEASYGINVISGDYFRVGCSSTGGDPFAGGIIDGIMGVATYPNIIPVTGDISGCISANCSIGFQLQSDASLTDLGVAITGFSIETLTLNATSYNTINGTSMASPEVAGLATMLRAHNPQYTYADVVNSIKQGGRAVAALAGKTTTGKSIDVMSSLAYINPPTGLTATVK
jgi:subtilisin family serine protease